MDVFQPLDGCDIHFNFWLKEDSKNKQVLENDANSNRVPIRQPDRRDCAYGCIGKQQLTCAKGAG